jgi:PhoPQ-activated pathogenicity-related protein
MNYNASVSAAAVKNHLLVLILFISFLIFSASCTRRTAAPEITFPLKDYVMAGDDAFSYKITDSVAGENWKAWSVKMVSGTWLTEKDVDSVTWWHWINIIIPDHLSESESMMFIGGGSSRDTVAPMPDEWLIQGAVATGSIISHISNIPFQPLDFTDDDKGGRYEDDLIAYGWRKYIESGASEDKMEWLARFPMTRAVVRAMDVVQEISRQKGAPVDSFFVAGASKRGWTTWTTAAVDNRVMAIAPIVIDLLNLIPSFKHHWQCYGEWSPAVEEYVIEGIMDRMDESEFKNLLEKVEPYSFAGELTIPKYIVNATSDEFFVTDSWKFYWDDLMGESYLHYVPNGNHSLRNAYQPISLISFYQRIITGTAIPSFDWTVSNDTIYVEVDPENEYILNKWEAVNKNGRDFRKYVVGDAWYKEEINREEDGKYSIYIEKPAAGYKAALVEVIFNPGSVFPLTFTSGTVVTPDTYPFPPFQTSALKKEREL